MLMLSLLSIVFCGRVAHSQYSTCPPPELVHPCTCSQNGVFIHCSGDQAIDLHGVFGRLSAQFPKEQLYFKMLKINNSNIESIEYNTTDTVQFETIRILAPNLVKIHESAFIGTEETVDKFILNLTKHRYKPNLPRPYNWLNLLQSFKQLRSLFIIGPIDGLHLPDNAFPNLKKLNSVRFRTMDRLLTYENGAFAGLQLDLLELSPINRVRAGLVDLLPGKPPINHKEGIPLRLRLRNSINSLKESSFDQRAFAGCCKRPVHLELNDNPIESLEESVFKPFFKGHDENLVNIAETKIDGKTQANAWWWNDNDYRSRVVYFTGEDLHPGLWGFPIEKLGRFNKFIISAIQKNVVDNESELDDLIPGLNGFDF